MERWDQEQLFTDGDSFFQSLETGLKEAQKQILFEIYIFENDILGQRLIKLFIDARKRGVQVKIMVDGIGSPHWPWFFHSQLIEAGVECKVFHPVPWGWFPRSTPASTKNWLMRAIEFLQMVNTRNHRKVCIIDNTSVWLGSLNVSQVHLKSLSGPKAWSDLGVRLFQRDGVTEMTEAFEKAWNSFRENFKRSRLYPWPKARLPSLVRLNDTSRKRRLNYLDLVLKTLSAQKQIRIINAYFVPRGSLLRALKKAARNNVKVEIILPHKSDVPLIRWVGAALYSGLLEAKVHIFEFQPTMLHAKSLIIDDWAMVGTTNLNHRSLLHDLEVDVVLTSEEEKLKLNNHFQRLIEDCKVITRDHWQKLPFIERWGGRLLLLFRYWL